MFVKLDTTSTDISLDYLYPNITKTLVIEP